MHNFHKLSSASGVCPQILTGAPSLDPVEDYKPLIFPPLEKILRAPVDVDPTAILMPVCGRK